MLYRKCRVRQNALLFTVLPQTRRLIDKFMKFAVNTRDTTSYRGLNLNRLFVPESHEFNFHQLKFLLL